LIITSAPDFVAANGSVTGSLALAACVRLLTCKCESCRKIINICQTIYLLKYFYLIRNLKTSATGS
jgi:hypothetical protein